MANIFQKDFSLGWRPSDDQVNGPNNALLRMQNVKLDETGALTLTPGSSKINSSQLPSAPHTIYSKNINGTIYRFASTVAGNTYVDNANSYGTLLFAGNSGVNTAFGAAYNHVIICSNNPSGVPYNVKFVPSVSTTTIVQMGTVAPAAPTLTINNPFFKDMTVGTLTLASYTALLGTVSVVGSYIKIVQDTTILSGVASLVYGSATDTTNLSGGSVGLPTDNFNIEIKADDPTQLVKIVVIFKDFTDNKSYFTYEFANNDSVLNLPPGQALKLQCTRADFTIVGTPQWKNIGEVVVACDVLNTITNFYFDNLIFTGGTFGSLVGDLEYVLVERQSNVSQYTSFSNISPIVKISPQNTSVHVVISAALAGDADGFQVYRRGNGLPFFYLIKDTTAGFFDDNVSDQQALLTNVKLDENMSCIGILNDNIKAIVGPFFNRWIYFGASKIYISKIGNPDNYSLGTGVLTPYGNTSEVFMWAKKFGNSAILIGTSSDIYEVSGTLTELPDGTIDVLIRPTGCKNPPINDACAETANELYYVASDGIRQVNPSGNQPFWLELDLLFKGKTRYGMIPPKITSGNVDKFNLAVSHNELYFAFVDPNGLRKMFTYDLIRKYSYEFKSTDGGYGAPTCLITEENGNLLGGFADTANLYVRILNTGTLIDGITSQAIFIRTKVYNGDTPRQRKDSFTLKFKINTGGSGIEFRLYKDESASYVSLGFFSTSVSQELYIDLSSVIGICKSYQLEINGTVPAFKLEDFSIDYELRPVPLSYFRSQQTNYGIQGRKKIYELPIVIDTLSSPVTMTPYVDNVAQTPLTFSVANKTTINYLFNPATAGRDIFYTLLAAGSVQFEYYGDIPPKVIEPLPDSVTNFIIPYTNFGTYARKRIIAFAFVIDTNGVNMTFTPKVDGVTYSAKTVNTFDKRTYIYYFDSVVEGVDIGGVIFSSGTSTFEYFALALEDCISEKLPASATVYVIPNSNLGSYARKRFIAYAMVINTHGSNVNFTPVVDGVSLAVKIINTNSKSTFIYYFDSREEGIDIGGTLVGTSYFEFYAVSLEECISEKLPPSCTFLVIPTNNFGVSAKKRIRTIPFIINTRGAAVTYIPTIDGVNYPSAVFSTTDKSTVLYYFISDAFGIDIGGTLNCATKFEFYGLGQPENVETIPVGKLLDQLGPIEFVRNANIKSFRVRMIAEGILVNYAVYVDDVLRLSSSFTTFVNIDKTYEIPWIAKYLNGTTCRIELSSASVFHRFSSELRVNITGSTTQGKWMKI